MSATVAKCLTFFNAFAGTVLKNFVTDVGDSAKKYKIAIFTPK
jgi:hypothetical protein